jgi:tetratricopeptide (TPR) repeat protein
MQYLLPSSSIISLIVFILPAPPVWAATLPDVQGKEYQTVLRQAWGLSEQHDYAHATAILENVIARASREHNTELEATILNGAGTFYLKDGKYEEAEHAFKRSISLWTGLQGSPPYEVASPLGNLGSLYYQAGQLSRAEKLTARAISILKETRVNPSQLAILVSNIGAVYLAEHKEEQAQQAAEEAMRIYDTLDKSEQPGRAAVYSIMGAVNIRSGNLTSAETALRQALSIQENAYGPEDVHTAQSMGNLAILYSLQGKLETAEPLFARAAKVFARAGNNDSFVRNFTEEYAAVERKLGHKKQAKELSKQFARLSSSSAATVLSRNVVDVSAFKP